MKNQTDVRNLLFNVDEYYGSSPLKLGDVELLQVGRNFCSPDTVIPLHAHLDWYEVTIVKGGSGIVEANGCKIPVSEGDIFISLPCDTHAIYSDAKNPLKYDFLSFYPKNDEKRAALDVISAAIYPVEKRVFRSERIGYLVAAATEEVGTQHPDREEMLRLIVSQIIICLIRTLTGETASQISHLSDTAMLCFRIMNYIDTHIYSLKRLSELCKITNYNYSYLSALFSKETGTTLSDYFQKKKLDAALQLIKDGKLKIGRIAEMLGYSTIYAFSKAFKRTYGVSPSDARG